MAIRSNTALSRNGLRKHWQMRIRTRWDQPKQKIRRRAVRKEKANRAFPMPTSLFRPICNRVGPHHRNRQRLARGFIKKELREAGINDGMARYLKIAMDSRRKERHYSAKNVEMLKEYLDSVVHLGRRSRKVIEEIRRGENKAINEKMNGGDQSMAGSDKPMIFSNLVTKRQTKPSPPPIIEEYREIAPLEREAVAYNILKERKMVHVNRRKEFEIKRAEEAEADVPKKK